MAELGPRLRDAARRRTRGLVYCSITGFGGGEARRRAARLRPADPGARRADEHHRRARRASRPKVGVALVDVLAGLFASGRHPRRAAPPRRAAARASWSRSTCSRRCSRRWSTRAPPTRSPASSRGRLGNRHPSIAPYELFADRRRRARARGRQRPPVRRALRGARRAPELAADARFATNPARVENRDALGAELRRLLAARPAAEWARAARPRRASPPASSTTSPAPSRSPTALGLEPTVEVAARGRRRGRADPQPDPPLGDAADLPLGAAGPAAARRRLDWTDEHDRPGAGRGRAGGASRLPALARSAASRPRPLLRGRWSAGAPTTGSRFSASW